MPTGSGVRDEPRWNVEIAQASHSDPGYPRADQCQIATATVGARPRANGAQKSDNKTTDFSIVTLDEFVATLGQPSPPAVSRPLQALWHAGRNDWEKAHHIAQEVPDAAGSWVHAHVHRNEGDLSNARYWYQRAGQPEATDSLQSEWRRIVGTLLES